MNRITKLIPISIVIAIITLIGFNISHINIEKKTMTNTELQKPNNGDYKNYYDNGNLLSVEHYENNLKNGNWYYYYKNGRLKSKIHYQDNKLNGWISHYSEKGELIFMELYTKGHLVKKEILNDSLYKYKIAINLHGKDLFETQCKSCHQEVSSPSNKKKLSYQLFKSITPENALYNIPIDSTHAFYNDSSDIDMATFSTDSVYDIKALKNYWQQQQVSKIKFRKNWKYKPKRKSI